MKINVETQKTITLVLNEVEANWLRSHMQNPLHHEHPDEEPKEDKKMRKIFWDALNNNR